MDQENKKEFIIRIIDETISNNKFQKLKEENIMLNNTLKIDISNNEYKEYEFDKVYDQQNDTYDMYLTLGKQLLEKSTKRDNIQLVGIYGGPQSGKSQAMTGFNIECNGLVELILHKLILRIHDGKEQLEKESENGEKEDDDDSEENLEEGIFIRYYGLQDNKLIDFLNDKHKPFKSNLQKYKKLEIQEIRKIDQYSQLLNSIHKNKYVQEQLKQIRGAPNNFTTILEVIIDFWDENKEEMLENKIIFSEINGNKQDFEFVKSEPKKDDKIFQLDEQLAFIQNNFSNILQNKPKVDQQTLIFEKIFEDILSQQDVDYYIMGLINIQKNSHEDTIKIFNLHEEMRKKVLQESIKNDQETMKVFQVKTLRPSKAKQPHQNIKDEEKKEKIQEEDEEIFLGEENGIVEKTKRETRKIQVNKVDLKDLEGDSDSQDTEQEKQKKIKKEIFKQRRKKKVSKEDFDLDEREKKLINSDEEQLLGKVQVKQEEELNEQEQKRLQKKQFKNWKKKLRLEELEEQREILEGDDEIKKEQIDYQNRLTEYEFQLSLQLKRNYLLGKKVKTLKLKNKLIKKNIQQQMEDAINKYINSKRNVFNKKWSCVSIKPQVTKKQQKLDEKDEVLRMKLEKQEEGQETEQDEKKKRLFKKTENTFPVTPGPNKTNYTYFNGKKVVNPEDHPIVIKQEQIDWAELDLENLLGLKKMSVKEGAEVDPLFVYRNYGFFNRKISARNLKNKNYLANNMPKFIFTNIVRMQYTKYLDKIDVPQEMFAIFQDLLDKIKSSAEKIVPDPRLKNLPVKRYSQYNHSHFRAYFLKITEENYSKFQPDLTDSIVHQQCYNLDFRKSFEEQKELISKINFVKQQCYELLQLNLNSHYEKDETLCINDFELKFDYYEKVKAGIEQLMQGVWVEKF